MGAVGGSAGKAVAAKPDSLSLVPNTHVVEEKNLNPCVCFLFIFDFWCTSIHSQSHESKESLALVSPAAAPAAAADTLGPARRSWGALTSQSLLLLSVPEPGCLCPLWPRQLPV